MAIGRLLLRFVLVPLGVVLAALVATFVVLVGHWGKFLDLIHADPQSTFSIVLNVVIVGPFIVMLFSIGAFIMLLPALVSVVASEVFALRSWWFHAASGAFWMWLGWLLMEDFRKSNEMFDDPMLAVVAGLIAGLAYWMVAGWNAGFWKPVFRPAPVAMPTAPITPTAPRA